MSDAEIRKVGDRFEVWLGLAEHTKGGLKKDDFLRKGSAIVARKASERAKARGVFTKETIEKPTDLAEKPIQAKPKRGKAKELAEETAKAVVEVFEKPKKTRSKKIA